MIGLLAQAMDNVLEANAQGDANSVVRPYPQIVGQCSPSALLNESPAGGQQLDPLIVAESGEESFPPGRPVTP